MHNKTARGNVPEKWSVQNACTLAYESLCNDLLSGSATLWRYRHFVGFNVGLDLLNLTRYIDCLRLYTLLKPCLMHRVFWQDSGVPCLGIWTVKALLRRPRVRLNVSMQVLRGFMCLDLVAYYTCPVHRDKAYMRRRRKYLGTVVCIREIECLR